MSAVQSRPVCALPDGLAPSASPHRSIATSATAARPFGVTRYRPGHRYRPGARELIVRFPAARPAVGIRNERPVRVDCACSIAVHRMTGSGASSPSAHDRQTSLFHPHSGPERVVRGSALYLIRSLRLVGARSPRSRSASLGSHGALTGEQSAQSQCRACQTLLALSERQERVHVDDASSRLRAYRAGTSQGRNRRFDNAAVLRVV